MPLSGWIGWISDPKQSTWRKSEPLCTFSETCWQINYRQPLYSHHLLLFPFLFIFFCLFLPFCLFVFFFLWKLLTNKLSATIFASKYFVQLIFMMSSEIIIGKSLINEKQFRSLIVRPVGFVRQTFFLSGFSPWNLSKALRTFGKGLVQIRQQNRRNTERGGKGKYNGAITSHQLRMSVNASSHFGQSSSRDFAN